MSVQHGIFATSRISDQRQNNNVIPGGALTTIPSSAANWFGSQQELLTTPFDMMRPFATAGSGLSVPSLASTRALASTVASGAPNTLGQQLVPRPVKATPRRAENPQDDHHVLRVTNMAPSASALPAMTDISSTPTTHHMRLDGTATTSTATSIPWMMGVGTHASPVSIPPEGPLVSGPLVSGPRGRQMAPSIEVVGTRAPHPSSLQQFPSMYWGLTMTRPQSSGGTVTRSTTSHSFLSPTNIEAFDSTVSNCSSTNNSTLQFTPLMSRSDTKSLQRAPFPTGRSSFQLSKSTTGISPGPENNSNIHALPNLSWDEIRWLQHALGIGSTPHGLSSSALSNTVAATSTVTHGSCATAASNANMLTTCTPTVKQLDEEEAMDQTCSGRAWKLTEAIQKIGQAEKDIKPVAADDMFYAAEKLFQAQMDFASRGLPTKVDIGYHYTRKGNLENIRRHGLMSRKERMAMNVSVERFNGALHGEGIYTGNDPNSFRRFGDVGLIVARLQGWALNFRFARRQYDKGNTSITKNNNMVVLQNSNQCLPLVQYPTKVSSSEVKLIAGQLQVLIHRYFNKRKLQTCFSVAGLKEPSIPEVIQYTAPDSLGYCNISSVAAMMPMHCILDDLCSVCLCPLQTCATTKQRNPVVKLLVCQHQFHSSCLKDTLKNTCVCPVCQIPVTGKLQGTMPSGSMHIQYQDSMMCQGFEDCNGSIVIHYEITSGIQKSYHQNPGHCHGGANQTAFLPHNKQGIALLKRLKFAFQHGLTFCVGTSITTGQPNSVTWSSIHHKTSRSGGVHGFPDSNFFLNCHSELDALGVPQFD